MKRLKGVQHLTRIISRQCRFQAECAIPASALVQAADALLREIGQLAAIEGIIPGHLKLLIKTGQAGLAMSMTRLDVVDSTQFGGWENVESLSDYEATINVHLLSPVLLDEANLLSGLEPGLIINQL